MNTSSTNTDPRGARDDRHPWYERASGNVTPGSTARRSGRYLPELGRWLVDGLFDDTCLGCRRRPAAGRLGLCPPCRARLDPHEHGTRCQSCAAPLLVSGASYRCGECLAEPPPWHRLFTVWSYRPPFDAVIHAFKFARLEALGSAMAREAFDRHADDLFAGIEESRRLVVPIPLPWPRRLRRGFNQAESIAAPLAQRLGVPLRDALCRRFTTPQSLLPLRRRRQPRSRFRARGRTSGAVALLVDDVVTTGATLREATAALKRAGALEVRALAVAWTPPRESRAERPEPSAGARAIGSIMPR